MSIAKSGLFAIALLAGGVTGMGVASAAPSGAADASLPATFDCGAAGVYSGFANSGNSRALTWNPYFLTASDGSTAVLVPTANDVVITVDGVVVFAPDATRGSNVGAVTCATSLVSGDVTVGGSVVGDLVDT